MSQKFYNKSKFSQYCWGIETKLIYDWVSKKEICVALGVDGGSEGGRRFDKVGRYMDIKLAKLSNTLQKYEN